MNCNLNIYGVYDWFGRIKNDKCVISMDLVAHAKLGLSLKILLNLLEMTNGRPSCASIGNQVHRDETLVIVF